MSKTKKGHRKVIFMQSRYHTLMQNTCRINRLMPVEIKHKNKILILSILNVGTYERSVILVAWRYLHSLTLSRTPRYENATFTRLKGKTFGKCVSTLSYEVLEQKLPPTSTK